MHAVKNNVHCHIGQSILCSLVCFGALQVDCKLMTCSTALQAEHKSQTAKHLVTVKVWYACAYLVPFQLLQGVAAQQMPDLGP